MMQNIFRKQIAIPQDHGSWIFVLSPLFIGLFAGGKINTGSYMLILAVMMAFLIRQPITILIKIYSKRRSRKDLAAAIFWTVFYGAISGIALLVLINLGYGYILYLAIPGIPVFIWHLWLVSRRAERHQIGIEIIASGVLALSAPAAYWIGVGGPQAVGWWLFLLTWLQSAASIVYAYFRLYQRDLDSKPNFRASLKMSHRALAYTSFNLLFVFTLSMLGILPTFLFLPYGLQWAENWWGITHPATGIKPTRIGVRQLIVSIIFTILFIWTWQIGVI